MVELHPDITKDDILAWLREDDPTRLDELWKHADDVRRTNVGDEVHLRGLIELSNYCRRRCAYCGLHVDNRSVQRYRMDDDEILGCVRDAVSFGYGTVVLQSGEDPGLTLDRISNLIRRIRQESDLAVTLSLGERSRKELLAWREAGADRYLLRFETSNPTLFHAIHPPVSNEPSDRIQMLRDIRAMDFETGSGVMVGIPGQTFDDLAGDIAMFRTLGLDMIGVGPFLPHPDTRLGSGDLYGGVVPDQVPNTELMTYKTVALTRTVRPDANIPSTTALATVNLANGRELGLSRGANIVMPNLTPPKYRALYEIYPAKACIQETGQQCHACMEGRIRSIGRVPGSGRGDSVSFDKRRPGN
jgi:biotin synthase